MMDWGLISVGLAVVLLLGHLFFDFRSLALKLRGPHSSGSYDTGYTCERCHARWRGKEELRHEVYWTVAAVVVLVGHIIMDLIGKVG